LEKGISKVITVFDWKSRKELRKISYKRDIRAFAVSYDGSRIAFHEENSIDIANSSDGAVFQSIRTIGSDAGYVDNLQLSPDGSKVISYIVNENEGRTVNMWNVATGALVWSLPEYYVAEIFYLPGDKALMFRTWKKGLVMIDPETGGVLAVSEKPFMKNNFIAVSRDGKRGLVQNETSGKFELWDLQSGVMKGNMAIGEEKNRSVSFKFLTNSKMAVSRIFNTIIWWDTETLKEVARMMLFRHSNDWVLYTVDGHFDATPFAMKSLYYTRGKEVIPFDALYENYYTPNLLLKLMEGIPLPVPGNEIKDLKKAPVVKITYAAVQRNLVVDEDLPFYRNTTGAAEITVIADAPEDGIDEIRVFHNGKIVNLVTRNLIVAEDSKSKSVTKKYTINLLPGQNTIRALALNTQRTESKPDEIAVYYKNEQNPQNTPSKRQTNNSGFVAEIDKSATLYLIVVGINKYQNSSMSLNYALADATTFKQELEQDAKTVVAEIKTHFITDDQANKPGITDAFESVAKNALPQDVFLFYYAGHGVINKSSNEFYLVPNDITDLRNVTESLVQKGISARLLQEYATKIAAQKQLFILDACQSAGAFQSIITEDAGKQKSIAIVARTTGTHWIAASGAQQFANEFSQLGHGAFTYVLLEALKGSAATDKLITVNGLKDYLQLGVPELMKKYSGTLQYPASYGFGNDFPVEKLQ
jgi:WD40 repeat protein